MRSYMSLAALLLLGITGISAKGSGKNWVSGPDTGANWGKCWGQPYGGGIDFEPNRDTVKWHIKRACWGWEDKGHHRGAYENTYYKPWSQSPYSYKVCVDTDSDSHINMEIANLNPNVGFTLGNGDCEKELSDIVNTYYQGGETQCNGWWFRIDPNRGRC